MLPSRIAFSFYYSQCVMHTDFEVFKWLEIKSATSDGLFVDMLKQAKIVWYGRDVIRYS